MATTTNTRGGTTSSTRANTIDGRDRGGGTWRPVAGWQAFDRLEEFRPATDPTYALLRQAGYQPCSIASFHVEEMTSTNGGDKELEGDEASQAIRTADIESICRRCAVDPTGRPTHGRSGTIRAACFLDSHGRRFVHVDGAGCDQATVARYFGSGCEKRGEPGRMDVRTNDHGAGGGTH